MHSQLNALALCAIILIAGCARSGSSSAERGQDSTPGAPATADQLPPGSQEVRKVEMPVAMEVPDAPDPKPTGWSTFDSYFQQLLTVHKSAVAATFSEPEMTRLTERAQALSTDNSKEYEGSRPMRELLVTQIRDLSLRTKDQGPKKEPMVREENLRMLQNIIQMTQEVIQRDLPTHIPDYIPKIESMRIALENSVMRIQWERTQGGH